MSPWSMLQHVHPTIIVSARYQSDVELSSFAIWDWSVHTIVEQGIWMYDIDLEQYFDLNPR